IDQYAMKHAAAPSFPTRRSSDLRRAPRRPVLRPVERTRAVWAQAHPVAPAARVDEKTGPVPPRAGALAVVVRCRLRRSGLLHIRSEEHTSELQSLAYLVCRLLLE